MVYYTRKISRLFLSYTGKTITYEQGLKISEYVLDKMKLLSDEMKK
jgi:hypothetical protein